MTGKTHRAGGALASVIGYSLLKEHGYLIQDVPWFLQYISMYPYVIWGSVASDFDGNEESIPVRDIFSRSVNKLLHPFNKVYSRWSEQLRDSSVDSRYKRKLRNSIRYKVLRFFTARHRSWQTHSDLTLLLLVLGLSYLFTSVDVSNVGTVLFYFIAVGFSMGMLSHILLDALTTEGIPLLFFKFINYTWLSKSRLQLPERLHLVPKSKMFSCESNWENFVRRLCDLATVVNFIWVLLGEYPTLYTKVVQVLEWIF